LAIGFAFLDQNPRNDPDTRHKSWAILTADNVEPFFWPIDVASGNVVTTAGLMVRTTSGGYSLDDSALIIRPPLDLHMSGGTHSADAEVLRAVYETALASIKAPGSSVVHDRITVATGWFIKAWRNTSTLHFAERLVFLKTAFEALTGTHKSHLSASTLRACFESLPDTTADDSRILVWSPSEAPTHTRTWKDRTGRPQTSLLTDLEDWFMAFGDARNTIVHEGIVPSLNFHSPNPAYAGHLVFTAEFLLRAVVKMYLTNLGYADLWRSSTYRAIKAELKQWNASGSTTEP
jgi:hypothetical protein